MVKHYYFYCMRQDFGPFFIKFCSYFPYTSKLCINGMSISIGNWPAGDRIRSARQRLLRCADSAARSALRELSMKRRSRDFPQMLSVLPHPYPAADRKAGFRYRLSCYRRSFPSLRFEITAARERVFRGSHPENIDLADLKQCS